MSTESQEVTAVSLMSMARESIVLLTVVIVAVIAGVAWTRFVVPFARAQAEITTKVAAALTSIQAIAESVGRTADAQRIHSEHLAKMATRLEEAVHGRDRQ
jgi:uncharacterized protein involved in outer membrane biogenesis